MREYWDFEHERGDTAFICGVVQGCRRAYLDPLFYEHQDMDTGGDVFYLGENGEIPLAQAMRERCSLYNGYMTGDGNGGWKSLPRHDDFDFELPEPDSCKDFRLAIKGMMPADADEKKVDKAVQVFYNEVRDYLDDRDITVYLAGHDIIEQLTAAMHYNYFVLSAMFVRMGNYMFMLTVGCD